MKLRMEDLEQVTGGKSTTGNTAVGNGRTGGSKVIRIQCRSCPTVFATDITQNKAECPTCHYPNPIVG